MHPRKGLESTIQAGLVPDRFVRGPLRRHRRASGGIRPRCGPKLGGEGVPPRTGPRCPDPCVGHVGDSACTVRMSCRQATGASRCRRRGCGRGSGVSRVEGKRTSRRRSRIQERDHFPTARGSGTALNRQSTALAVPPGRQFSRSIVAFSAGRIPWPLRQSSRVASRGGRRTLASPPPRPKRWPSQSSPRLAP